jgi:hypothetical protein
VPLSILGPESALGAFSEVPQFGTGATIPVAWGDHDLDGDLDLAVGNGILGAVQQNFLYINNGDGSFTSVPQFGTEQTGSLVWGRNGCRHRPQSGCRHHPRFL